MVIKSIEAHILDIPLRRPHKLSFATLKAINFVLVRLRTDDGTEGLGEAALLGGPTWSEESAESVKTTIDHYLSPVLLGQELANVEVLLGRMDKVARGNCFAKAAVEMAALDALGRAYGIPVYALLGGKCRDRVLLSWSIASEDTETELREANERKREGFKLLKIKTAAGEVARDLKRVRELKAVVGGGVNLRIDANQGWDRQTAIRAIRGMEEYIEFAEQPVPRWDIDGMAAVCRSAGVPVMADESCCTPQDAVQLVKREAAHIFALKLTKAGGILASKKVAHIGQGAGIGCYVGCMIETSVGTSAYLQVALSTPNVVYGCELFGPLLLVDDIVKEPVQYKDGHILSVDRPGLGMELDEAKVARYARRTR